MSAVVTDTIRVCSRVGGSPGHITLQLAYEPNDPYAVHLMFPAADDPHEWAFARDLLAKGMHKQVGDGDAQVWPGSSGFLRPPQILHILLSSPDGRIELDMPWDFVRRFLLASFVAVPGGREGRQIDWVRETRELLREDA